MEFSPLDHGQPGFVAHVRPWKRTLTVFLVTTSVIWSIIGYRHFTSDVDVVPTSLFFVGMMLGLTGSPLVLTNSVFSYSTIWVELHGSELVVRHKRARYGRLTQTTIRPDDEVRVTSSKVTRDTDNGPVSFTQYAVSLGLRRIIRGISNRHAANAFADRLRQLLKTHGPKISLVQDASPIRDAACQEYPQDATLSDETAGGARAQAAHECVCSFSEDKHLARSIAS